MLADLWDRDRIVQKAHGGRGHEAIREIPVKSDIDGDLEIRISKLETIPKHE